MTRDKLEKGWARGRLILELAQGEKTQTQLAAEYGVTPPAVSQFKDRHRDEIEARRLSIEDEWAGLWIADKRNRIAECQEDVEAINDALDAEKDPNLFRAKLAVMRQVAEELGQLKGQVELTGQLTYVVEGVDLEKLR